ncbi:UDP-glucuronosyl/UDP-glucosyltransferase family-containing protein [Strongyloides ratti]|uniref:glucuronosyltransferase n=1 Tax=Strongyloides ratti TaxID=34506 RepID=A0A090LMI7_STRRB|nr:UDP-glucuronosyl/UDP-glucosyltransferase family-containing protein [Strongyloides ratti]CEF68740.1 UDP-glucuronosyl/UDP-glucosyltransferase family-containing protein [Strongyloides ratti]
MYIFNYLLLFSLSFYTWSYKILLYNPKFSHSHVNFVSQISDILVEAGHDVTVIVTEMDINVKHPGTKNGKIYKASSHPTTVELMTNNVLLTDMWNRTNDFNRQVEMMNQFMKACNLQARHTFYDKDLETFVKSQNFDIAFSELLHSHMFGLFKAWGIKTHVSGCATALFDAMYAPFGLPFPSSYVPNLMNPYTDKMTYKERFNNLIANLINKLFIFFKGRNMVLQDLFDEKYGEGKYEIRELVGDSSFVFINTNPLFNLPGAKTPKMIEVGGIGISESMPLDNFWNKTLSLRQKNVLISFGSIAKSSLMPEHFKKSIIKTIKTLSNITFIWKYETPDDGISDGVDNLILSKWIPQNDLLNDSRMSLFITHGGLNSLTELAYQGVPALAIPMFSDQFANSKLLEKAGIGESMPRDDLKDSDKLISTIISIINNNVYRNNSMKLSKMMKNYPFKARKELTKYIEFAAEFGKLPIPVPVWAYADNNVECIKLKVSATLTLAYFQKGEQTKSYASVPLLSNSAVDKDNSSCQILRKVNSFNIMSQVLSLKYPSKYPGWGITFYFTNDTKLFKITDNYFGLYQIQINANFSSMPNTFINPQLKTHVYTSRLNLDDNDNLINSIYAHKDHSYSCPSSQVFELIGPQEDILEASIKLKNFRVQAFTSIDVSNDDGNLKYSYNYEIKKILSTTTSIFQTKEICPIDQTEVDLVPIVAGSILVGLILINLIFYLVYRCRLTNEALMIVNDNSHFTDKIYDKKIGDFNSLDNFFISNTE